MFAASSICRYFETTAVRFAEPSVIQLMTVDTNIDPIYSIGRS